MSSQLLPRPGGQPAPREADDGENTQATPSVALPLASSITFESVAVTDDAMTYVINLEDGGGQEFFLSTECQLVSLKSQTEASPETFRSYKATARRIEQIQERYPESCHIYALEIAEFEQRQRVLQNPSGTSPITAAD
jgi:hypothetical protein